jgi:glycosyltransferase involved in cell wall biosynthesis
MESLSEKNGRVGYLIARGQEHVSPEPKHEYVLMTSAYNEEAHIDQMILSVVSQTVLPKRWVIVSDGSMDKTDEIIRKYAEKHDFIRYLRRTKPPGRSFGSKARALMSGLAILEGVRYAFIGNVDADVWLEPSFFENLLNHFDRRPSLGLAGGQFFEEDAAGEFKSRKSNRIHSVTHAAQLVRRECYEAIGGYAVLEYGGEDWHAEVTARMKGWEIESFPTLKIFHQRHTGEGGSLLRYKFRQGRMDYSLGCDPSFEILKCLLRIRHKPFLVGCMARLTGFSWSWICRDKRPVSKEFVAYLRSEQKARVAALLRGGGLKRSIP